VVVMSPQAPVSARTRVYTTESRELPPSEAVRSLRGLLPQVGRARLYKKVDSTLRGNVGYELRALTALPMVQTIVVAPAFPQGGRTTIGGVQRVHGRPLALTEFRHDPRWPMRESHVPTLLMQQAGMEVALVELEVVARGAQALASALRAQAARIIVVDAATDADLACIAHTLDLLGPRWVPCGSAGLAQPWAASVAGKAPAPLPVDWPVLTGGALFVCGSRNPVTLGQIEALTAVGVPRVTLDAQASYDERREADRLTHHVCASLREGADLILEASTTPLLPGAGPRIARILASVTVAAAGSGHLRALFMTGGDVAIALCRHLGVEALRIAAQIQPGLPGGQLIGGLCDGLPAATKAGGLGDERALVDVRRWFAGLADAPPCESSL
jgi:D-threonate/D-erythronate kinase